MDKDTNHPQPKPEVAVSKACVDAAKVIATDIETQDILDGWHESSDIYRGLARHVSKLLKSNRAEALALRKALTEWRLLVRELRSNAYFGGGI